MPVEVEWVSDRIDPADAEFDIPGMMSFATMKALGMKAESERVCLKRDDPSKGAPVWSELQGIPEWRYGTKVPYKAIFFVPIKAAESRLAVSARTKGMEFPCIELAVPGARSTTQPSFEKRDLIR